MAGRVVSGGRLQSEDRLQSFLEDLTPPNPEGTKDEALIFQGKRLASELKSRQLWLATLELTARPPQIARCTATSPIGFWRLAWANPGA